MNFIDLAKQQERIRAKLDTRLSSVLDEGRYIMGPEVQQLEDELAAFCKVKHVITCANGTDALQLALMTLGAKPGEAIFCPSFTFAATAEVVPMTGATPVFVDVDKRTFNMSVESLERAIVESIKQGLTPAGIIPVDLFGLPAAYDELSTIAENHGLWVLCDSAQGFGSSYKGRMTATLGAMATTSFFPAKPLGCYGDGGAVFTNNDQYADMLRSLRVHGKGTHKYDNERIGINSRLDTFQAAILLEKLAIYPEEIESRNKIAEIYSLNLSELIDVPVVPEGCNSVWAQYTVTVREQQNRDEIIASLKQQGVPTAVYYPLPLHQQTAYRDFPADPSGLQVAEQLAKSVFSLPMHPYLEDDQQQVIDAMQKALS